MWAMPKILIKPDAEGNIVISREVLQRLGSRKIELEVGEEGVVLAGEPTTQQRIQAFRQWTESFPTGPGLSDWAVSRDSIYD